MKKGNGQIGKIIIENCPACGKEKKVKLKKIGGVPPKNCGFCEQCCGIGIRQSGVECKDCKGEGMEDCFDCEATGEVSDDYKF